jgi:hypothetical protein
MPRLSRPTPPPPPPQPRSLQPQTFGLSLLDDNDDSLSNEQPPKTTAAVSNDDSEDKSRAFASLDSNNSSSNTVAGPYDFILEQARAAQLELETVRDDLYWLQVSNCRTLDALCMVTGGSGAIDNDDDEDAGHVGDD